MFQVEGTVSSDAIVLSYPLPICLNDCFGSNAFWKSAVFHSYYVAKLGKLGLVDAQGREIESGE